jgi:hypothetical protein
MGRIRLNNALGTWDSGGEDRRTGFCFLKPPVIRDVDCGPYTGRVGECIVIEAVDTFGVKEVALTITLGTFSAKRFISP